MNYVVAQLLGGRYDGQLVGVWLRDGEIPERVFVGEQPYIRYRKTLTFVSEGEVENDRKKLPIPLPRLRGYRPSGPADLRSV